MKYFCSKTFMRWLPLIVRPFYDQFENCFRAHLMHKDDQNFRYLTARHAIIQTLTVWPCASLAAEVSRNSNIFVLIRHWCLAETEARQIVVSDEDTMHAWCLLWLYLPSTCSTCMTMVDFLAMPFTIPCFSPSTVHGRLIPLITCAEHHSDHWWSAKSVRRNSQKALLENSGHGLSRPKAPMVFACNNVFTNLARILQRSHSKWLSFLQYFARL